MSKQENRIYSRHTHEVIKLLASQLKASRTEKKITMAELSERAGISRDLLYRIEKADPSCGIGVVFEVATLLGFPLFQKNTNDLILKNKALETKLALLPKRVRNKNIKIDDDF